MAKPQTQSPKTPETQTQETPMPKDEVNSSPVSDTNTIPKTAGYVVPQGMRKTTGDVIGFHDLEDHGPIHGIPRGAKLSDSQINARNVSCFIIFEILDPCVVINDDDESMMAKKGDMVGVWTKPGMRAVAKCAGIPVFIAHTGEKDVHKGKTGMSPMKTYDIYIGEGKGELIPVIEDNRDESINEKHFLVKGSGSSAPF
jgi:hypothetical protein